MASRQINLRRFIATGLVVVLTATAASQSFASPMPRRQSIGAAAAGTSAQSQAQEQPNPERPKLGPPSGSELQSYGCLGIGLPAMGIATFAGDTQLLLLFTGGTIAPTAPLALGMAVAGTVFASFCAIGALATPGIVRIWHIYYDGEETQP
jgi:hypothetical protein